VAWISMPVVAASRPKRINTTSNKRVHTAAMALNVAMAAVWTLLLLVVLMRFGLLAATTGMLIHATLQAAPLGMDLGGWPTSRTVLALLIVLGAGAYGFARSLGGRPAVRDVLAEG